MILKNKNIRTIIVSNIIILTLFSIVFAITVYFEYSKYNKIINNFTANIIQEVKKEYPNISEKEIMDIIQNKNNYDKKQVNEKLFKEYGYLDNKAYLQEMKDEIDNSIKIYLTLIVGYGIIILIMYLISIKKQEKEIADIYKYLKQINKKKYELKIENNSEDELSKLRNELYKTTILLKEAAENSKEESKNLSNALADISHQLKTPLTSIRIMIDNLYDNPDMDKQIRMDFIKTISKQLDWISSLVISLLKLAKFDAGTIKMNDNKINAKELINEVINNLAIILDVKNIKVNIESPTNVFFKADYKWQLEAITNIVKNSIEHSFENSEINIKIENSSVFLKIVIQDKGKGIKKKDIKHIFNRFYKADNSSENSIGIGLSLSKIIIEKDNGYITVDSEENKGTTFEIKYLK